LTIQPKRGFSILFITIIGIGSLIKLELLGLLALVLLIFTLFIKDKNIQIGLFFGSFFIFIQVFSASINISLLNYLMIYFLPISLISGIFSLMMIGHWFLVDPTISKEGMKKIAIVTSLQSLALIPLVQFDFINSGIVPIYKLVIICLYATTSILAFASYKSLNEKSYTGVMAATGLSYLSLIVSIGATGTLLLF
jgi:signal transduction histidine kinase